MNVSFTLYLDLQVHRERQYGSCRDGSGESYSIFSFAQSHFFRPNHDRRRKSFSSSKRDSECSPAVHTLSGCRFNVCREFYLTEKFKRTKKGWGLRAMEEISLERQTD